MCVHYKYWISEWCPHLCLVQICILMWVSIETYVAIIMSCIFIFGISTTVLLLYLSTRLESIRSMLKYCSIILFCNSSMLLLLFPCKSANMLKFHNWENTSCKLEEGQTSHWHPSLPTLHPLLLSLMVRMSLSSCWLLFDSLLGVLSVDSTLVKLSVLITVEVLFQNTYWAEFPNLRKLCMHLAITPA